MKIFTNRPPFRACSALRTTTTEGRGFASRQSHVSSFSTGRFLSRTGMLWATWKTGTTEPGSPTSIQSWDAMGYMGDWDDTTSFIHFYPELDCYGLHWRLGPHNQFHPLLSRGCLLYTSPSPRDSGISRMPSSA